jgi:hypothetical protein
VQHSVASESYPTHPLGKGESWPVTGPIYGIPELEAQPGPSATIWQRWVTGTSEIPENVAAAPVGPPIWY